jgi:hypothetical protein
LFLILNYYFYFNPNLYEYILQIVCNVYIDL